MTSDKNITGRKAQPADGAIIPAANYPAPLPRHRLQHAMKTLKSSEILECANSAVAAQAAPLRAAVLELVSEIDGAMQAQDWPVVFEKAHEIRGLAGTAGLAATGRIANGLCRYLDTLTLLNMAPDASVAALHVGAILRSVRTEDDAARHGAAVAEQLESLVARKLGEIKDSATP